MSAFFHLPNWLKKISVSLAYELGAAMVLSDAMERFMSCCVAFGQLCCESRTSCCTPFNYTSKVIKSRKINSDRSSYRSTSKDSTSKDVLNGESDSRTELFKIEISGMTCPDCLWKIKKSIAKLPSLKTISLDYFNGFAELQCNPGTQS